MAGTRRGKGLRMRLLPRRATPQLVLLLVVTLLLAQGITLWLLARQGKGALREAGLFAVLHRVSNAYLLVQVVDPQNWPRVLHALSGHFLEMTIDGQAALDRDRSPVVSTWIRRHLEQPATPVRAQLGENGRECVESRGEGEEHLGEPHEARHRRHFLREYWRRRGCAPSLVIAIRLPEGGWLNARALPPPPGDWWIRASLLGVGIAALALVVVAAWAVRRILRPLGKLSEAAESFGRGEVLRVREEGPQDVREAIHAFNTMQARVSRAMSDRSRLLAALSHDLRTPITSMRLRVELLPDGEDKRRLLQSLEEMEALAAQTLEFMRGSERERSRRFDLDALIDSICGDFADMNAPVRYQGTGRLLMTGRPDALRRALRNLIDNAVKYGVSADVRLVESANEAVITITDQGPGIAEADREKVFEPFVRLEGSRSRDTGGAGLGMAIARTMVRQMGGDVSLASSPQGSGLMVRVQLPLGGPDGP